MLIIKQNIEVYRVSAFLLGLIALIIALVALVICMYCYVNISPQYYILELKYDFTAYDKVIQNQFSNQIFLLGNTAIFLATLSIIIGFFSILKSKKIGWFAVVLGFVVFGLKIYLK